MKTARELFVDNYSVELFTLENHLFPSVAGHQARTMLTVAGVVGLENGNL